MFSCIPFKKKKVLYPIEVFVELNVTEEQMMPSSVINDANNF